MARPRLSIGIIFKNEIRCLERCLKSFQTLRETVPCEIVMADTGSTDGSREIAAKYADILFDFPWINDFSAARNTVMDHCSGKWFLSIDADEWLDKDISELVELLTSDRRILDKTGAVVIRNYQTEALDPNRCTNMYVDRIVRMSSHIRYVGRIHEYIPLVGVRKQLKRTILHHDGYAIYNTAQGKAKLERNRNLLRLEIESDPNNVRFRCLLIESSFDQPDQFDQICQAIELIKEKKWEWSTYGPSVLRHGIISADANNRSELEKWSDMAHNLFPDSFFTRIDIAYILAHRCWREGDYTGCANWCGEYFRGIHDLHNGEGDIAGLVFGILRFDTGTAEQAMRSLQIRTLYRCGKSDEADEILELADCPTMNKDQFTAHVRNLIALHAEKPIQKLYEQISAPGYSDNCAEEQRKIFFQEAAATFAPTYREKEENAEDFTQFSYTLFAPLNGKCEIGTAATVMQTEDIRELEELLATVEDWDYLPVAALEHILQKNVHFPPAGKFLTLEEMDKLASRLNRNTQLTTELVLSGAEALPEDLASLLWIRGVAIVAVQSCRWQDPEQGRTLSRAFAKVVGSFVSRYYTEEALRGENFRMLPGMYRSAWYCQKAFDALDGGDCGEYVRLLRKGVTAYPGTKKMAAFLLDNTPEVNELLAPSPEVQALVDQVRAIMARYDPNDPAVAALKQSEAYRKVAHLIEDKR